MHIKSYARKKRQFSFLIKKIKRLQASNWSGFPDKAKSRLILKAREQFKFLKNRLSLGGLKRATAVLAMVAGLVAPSMINAQETNYAAPEVDPFGMSVIGYYQKNAFVDIDNDGDLDLISLSILEDSYFESQFTFSENVGNQFSPEFAEPISNPFNIPVQEIYLGSFAMVDMDGDGDFDILSGHYASINYTNSSLFYLENIGTQELPAFTESVRDPFGLEPREEDDYLLGLSFGDLDDDGDMDLVTHRGIYVEYQGIENRFQYFENIGDEQNPSFTESVEAPFGLESQNGLLTGGNLVDLDKDGDLDLVASVQSYYGSLLYYENIGDKTSPEFSTGIINPAGLESDTPHHSFSFADLDGDGDLDAVSTPSDYMEIILFFENLCIVSNLVDISTDHHITMSPNPTADKVRINIESEIGSLDRLKIYNLLGANVLNVEIENHEFDLDVSSLKSGQYYLILKNETGMVSKKLMIE